MNTEYQGRWNTVLPFLGFLASKYPGMLGQKGLIPGERNGRDVKIEYIVLCPYFYFLRANIFPAVGREESADRVYKMICSWGGFLLLFIRISLYTVASFQARAGGALGVAELQDLQTAPLVLVTWIHKQHLPTLCWSLQQLWKYYCSHWQLPWKVSGTFKALQDYQEKICLTSRKASLSPSCSCLSTENIAWCITSAFHYW